MSPLIEISDELYERLERLAVGFDKPANVIERLLDDRAASGKNLTNVRAETGQLVATRPAAMGHFRLELDLLSQAFQRVFGVRPRPFGQKFSPVSGFSDDAKGVQWNTAMNLEDGSAFLAVNLEGLKYRDWPIATFLLKEREQLLFPALADIPAADKIIVHLHRDAWQCAARPLIEEKEITGSGTNLKTLTNEIWLGMVEEGLACLDKQQGYRARKVQLVTLVKSGEQVEREVSPHLNLRTSLWSKPSIEVNEMTLQILAARDRLLPVYHRVLELSLDGDGALFSEVIDPETVRIDPSNPIYTKPRTFGVYKIKSTDAKKLFRSGNHPIRQKELVKEYGGAELVALYQSKDLALQRARLENDGG